MDISESRLSLIGLGFGTVFTFTGHFSFGGSIVQDVTLDDIFGMEQFNFSGFENLSHVTFDIGANDIGIQLDNIVLSSPSPIPEPTTMLLFGVGLMGLAGVSRRKK